MNNKRQRTQETPTPPNGIPIVRPPYVVPGDPYVPMDVVGNLPPHEGPYGQRQTKSGKCVQGYVAMRALSEFFSGEPNPIFTYIDNEKNVDTSQSDILPSSINRDIVQDQEDPSIYYYTTPPIDGIRRKVIFNQTLERAVANKEEEGEVLILLIVTKYHAILMMIHSGKLYTVGFGYKSNQEDKDVKNRVREKNQRLRIPLLERLVHSFELLDGALYSADMVAPNDNQEAKIAWIGFLTKDMIDRITLDLNATTNIMFQCNKDRNTYILTNYNYLMLDRRYSEASGFITRENSQNCIIWAQRIIGENLVRGMIGDPFSCKGVDNDQWEEFYEIYSAGGDLTDILNRIQSRLRPSGLGFGFGGKTKKNKRSHKKAIIKTYKKAIKRSHKKAIKRSHKKG